MSGNGLCRLDQGTRRPVPGPEVDSGARRDPPCPRGPGRGPTASSFPAFSGDSHTSVAHGIDSGTGALVGDCRGMTQREARCFCSCGNAVPRVTACRVDGQRQSVAVAPSVTVLKRQRVTQPRQLLGVGLGQLVDVEPAAWPAAHAHQRLVEPQWRIAVHRVDVVLDPAHLLGQLGAVDGHLRTVTENRPPLGRLVGPCRVDERHRERLRRVAVRRTDPPC